MGSSMREECKRLQKSVRTAPERNSRLVGTHPQHHRVSPDLSLLNLTPGRDLEPDQSHARLCPPLRIINIGLLRCISCMCLPCGSGLRLTNRANRHTACGAWHCCPDGADSKGCRGADQVYPETPVWGPVRQHPRESAVKFC